MPQEPKIEGPQHFTLHDGDEVVLSAAEAFVHLAGRRSGEALIAAMQQPPYREVGIVADGLPMPVRGVEL
jgi:hypothetical protein